MNRKPHPERKRLRLAEYDYSQPGAYFITTVTHNRVFLFGRVVDGAMCLNRFGQIVADAWNDLPHHYAHVRLDAFVVMPNHVHGVIVLVDDDTVPGKRHGLPEIVRAFKSFSARRINELRGTPGVPVWQRGYYDHIIRNDAEWYRIRAYIAANPQRWADDRDRMMPK